MNCPYCQRPLEFDITYCGIDRIESLIQCDCGATWLLEGEATFDEEI